jgi:hypothetical protein
MKARTIGAGFCALLFGSLSLAQEGTETFDDTLRKLLDARNDAKAAQPAYREWVKKLPNPTPGLQAAVEALDKAMADFGRPSTQPLAPAAFEPLLAEIAARRSCNDPPHHLLPLPLIVQKANQLDDARVAFALFEAWGTKSPVFDDKAAQSAAAAFDKAMAGATADAQTAIRKHFPELAAFRKNGAVNATASSVWLRELVARKAKELAPGNELRLVLRVEMLNTARAAFAEDVREATNNVDAGMQRDLQWLASLDRENTAPHLVRAMALASFGSGGTRNAINEELQAWEKGAKDMALATKQLEEVGWSVIAPGTTPAQVAQELKAYAKKDVKDGMRRVWTPQRTWFPDAQFVEKRKLAIPRERSKLEAENGDLTERIRRHDRAIAELEAEYKKTRDPGTLANLNGRKKDRDRDVQAIEKNNTESAELLKELEVLNGLVPKRPSFTLPELK